jgi:hypothetical protein
MTCKATPPAEATPKHPPSLPKILTHFVRPDDQFQILGCGPDAPLLVRSQHRGRGELLHGKIGPVTTPKLSHSDDRWFVQASLTGDSSVEWLVINGEAVRRYFYGGVTPDPDGILYSTLAARPNASVADIRLAWRLRQTEAALTKDSVLKLRCERAFNVLANPELRPKYDAHLSDPDSMLPFPYGGCGEILAAGNLSKDERTFFADSILAFKPEVQSKKVKVLLRQCEFLTDHVALLDSRRKLEIWMDAGLLDGLAWDPTWNRWKHWLRTRFDVNATVVKSSKYRLVRGEWVVKNWWTALPSRISVTVPASVHEDVARAQAIHELLGQHAEVVQKLREQIARQPIEGSAVQAWLDRLGASPQLRPEYTTWQPDYEDCFFGQLRKRARTWFLFRDEYLFILPTAIVSEVPSAGHATYVFATPRDQEGFLRLYGTATRNDIRHNRLNISAELGFIGRVVRGRKRKRWLADVLRLAGGHANYLDAVEDEEGPRK